MRARAIPGGRLPGSRRFGRTLFALLALSALPLLAQYDPKLQYQKRDNRFEGIKPKPVSGYDIELLSALVGDREPSASWPRTLRLKFYLPAAEPVFLTVRQPRPRTVYYWLDKVVPPTPWRAMAWNEYSWSTEPVLKQLTAMGVDDLGVVVRLRQQDPSKRETVAPAALFHTQPPAAPGDYRFTFKTNGTAYVTGRIYRDNQEIFRRPQNQEKGGSPFTLSWNSQGQPEGEYRLELSGYFSDNTPLAKEILFYHRPSWK